MNLATRDFGTAAEILAPILFLAVNGICSIASGYPPRKRKRVRKPVVKTAPYMEERVTTYGAGIR